MLLPPVTPPYFSPQLAPSPLPGASLQTAVVTPAVTGEALVLTVPPNRKAFVPEVRYYNPGNQAQTFQTRLVPAAAASSATYNFGATQSVGATSASRQKLGAFLNPGDKVIVSISGTAASLLVTYMLLPLSAPQVGVLFFPTTTETVVYTVPNNKISVTETSTISRTVVYNSAAASTTLSAWWTSADGTRKMALLASPQTVTAGPAIYQTTLQGYDGIRAMQPGDKISYQAGATGLYVVAVFYEQPKGA